MMNAAGLMCGARSWTMPCVGLIDRLRAWLRGGDEHEEMSESALRGSPAGGMGHHHTALSSLPADDRGVEGGPPSHEDPLKPPLR